MSGFSIILRTADFRRGRRGLAVDEFASDAPGRAESDRRVADLIRALDVSREFPGAPTLAALLALVEESLARLLDCDRAEVVLTAGLEGSAVPDDRGGAGASAIV